MPSGLVTRSLGKVADHVPGVRRIPVVALLTAAEVAVLAHDHYQRLTVAERRRLMTLVRVGRGRRSRLTAAEAAELAALLDKLQPRRLVGDAAVKLSPVPLPKRLVYGRRD